MEALNTSNHNVRKIIINTIDESIENSLIPLSVICLLDCVSTYLQAPISIKKSQKTSGSLSLSTLQKVMDRKAAVEVDASSTVVARNVMIVEDDDDDDKRCEDNVDVDDLDGVIIQASTEQAVKARRKSLQATRIVIVISGE